MAMILVALLPVTPNLPKQMAAQMDAQRDSNRHILHGVLEQVFQSICSPRQHGIELPCAEVKV